MVNFLTGNVPIIFREKLSDGFDNQQEIDLSDDEDFLDSNENSSCFDSSDSEKEFCEWGPVESRTRKFDFTGREKISKMILSECNRETDLRPVDVYSFFVSDELLEEIAVNTNIYAHKIITDLLMQKKSCYQEWKPTDAAEVKKFLGLVIYMGLNTKPDYTLHWSKNKMYTDSFTPNVMCRERFHLILRFFNCRSTVSSDENNEHLSDLQSLLEYLVFKYQMAYSPNSELFINESVIPAEGKPGHRQQLLGNSSLKRSLKIHKLCSTEGYTLNMVIHGTRTTVKEGLNLAESRAVQLLKDLINTGSTLYANKSFSSVRLAEYLLENQTYYCGPVRTNRSGLDKTITKAKLKKKEMVSSENKNGVKLYNWKDGRNVLMISTIPEHGKSLAIYRRNVKVGDNKVFRPECVNAYNNAKRNSSISDQGVAYSSPLLKSRKWSRKISFELLAGVTVINAFILYKKLTKTNIDQREFLESLILDLTSVKFDKIKPGKSSMEVSGARLHSLTEVIGPKRTSRKRCRGCYEKLSQKEGSKFASLRARRISTYCKDCKGQPFLCIACFSEKHSSI